MTPSDNRNYITRFDADLMAKEHFTDYKFVRKRGKWNYGREFVYKINNNEANVFISVGLHPSAEIAEKIATSYLNSSSIRMKEGAHKGISLGDKFWWYAGSDSNNLTNIVFIRKNSLILMSCSLSYSDLKSLAKKIDGDLIIGASYVTIAESINTPEIKSIIMEKHTVEINENLKIVIDAADPNHESLEYQFSPGLLQFSSDAENVYTYRASRNYIKDPDGTHVVRLVVINESNVVSPISETRISYIE